MRKSRERLEKEFAERSHFPLTTSLEKTFYAICQQCKTIPYSFILKLMVGFMKKCVS